MRFLKEVRQHFRNYHLKSGVFHFYRGEHGPAAEFLTRVLNDEGDVSESDRRAAIYYLVQTRIGAASEYESRGEIDRALEQYQLALDVMPSYPDVHFRFGLALLQQGQLEGALSHLEHALAVNPDYVEARVQLGQVLLKLSRDDEAREAFRRALDSRERGARARLAAAEQSVGRGDNGLAQEMYLDAFRETLDRFRVFYHGALEQLRNEKWEAAAAQLAAAAELCPRFADVHNLRGVALAETGRLDDAIEAFRVSVGINPHYVAAWINLAFAAAEHDEIEEAREALEQVLALEPDNAPAQVLAEKLGRKSRKRPPLRGTVA